MIGGAAVLMVVLTACGGGDDADAAKALSDEIMSQSDDSFQVDREQADCLGEGFVEELGVDQLQEYGLLTDDLEADSDLGDVKMSKADADAAAGVFVDCVDIGELLTGSMGLEGMDQSVIDCVSDVMTDDVAREAMAASFRGEDESAALNELMAPLQACLSGG